MEIWPSVAEQLVVDLGVGDTFAAQGGFELGGHDGRAVADDVDEAQAWDPLQLVPDGGLDAEPDLL